MRNIQIHQIKVGAEKVQVPTAQEGFLLALTEARLDERKNLTAVFAARLEAIAAHLIHKEIDGRGAVETLRQEAERIRSESEEIH
ncbi:DUF2732 family protein [Rouxiella chamberiensis]|uniref:DUF2732 family protein n=1 Tax=Rouxiella chamberiensis TaxID=1513468 RepID=A0ABY7HPS5_9GAMM|nr:DUF2732 family protein [Rouxiella chamberiensis]WAT01022.1 DUF2732 family protein [Rouxiella chamberiensis]